MSSEIIDVHIHFGAPEDGASGCYWSEDFEKGIAFFAMRLVTNNLFGKVTLERVKKHLFKVINGSKEVQKNVLLALDQVYREGIDAPDRDNTHLHVPNGYLAALVKEHDRTLFGASIHPYRTDWEAELQRCLADGAVLCKWIPSSMRIDPSNPACSPFYQKLAQAGLPLLCHVGPEGAIPPFDDEPQKLNSPLLLQNALNAGVTVIMAHAALPLLPPPLGNDQAFQEMMTLLRQAEQNNWKLYADISAINLGPRIGYIDDLKREPLARRLVFGSDYPIPILAVSQDPGLSFWDWMKQFFRTVFIKNPLDRNYKLIKNMGLDESVFTNASRILRLA